MFHNLSLLLALSVAPNAKPMLEPSRPVSAADMEQDKRSATANARSIVGTGGMGNAGALGGMPTYGATAGGGVTKVTPGRVQSGGQLLHYFTVTIDPGTGFSEDFILYVPKLPLGASAPLLVAFHGFGFSQKDITYNTSFASECAQRGWYMLAPLSASGGHFMSDVGMANTEAAMAWTLGKFKVNLARIYAVGFSMGGGMALNYGARHLDPNRGTFAAIYNHSGAVDLIDTYENDQASAFVFDFWYGDTTPYSADYDLMIRSSVIQYDSQLGQVDPTTDLVRNLNHVPLQTVRASNDPLTGLSLQCDRLDVHLQSLGRTPGPSYNYKIINGSVHNWDTISETEACDWLSQFTLALPTSQRTLAASESYYYYFHVDQTDLKKLTPFTWEIDPIANELRISETANMTRLSVLTTAAGLKTDQPLRVVMTTDDGLMNMVNLTGFSVKPASVVRDGMVLPQVYWTYSAGSGLVGLTEYDGAGVHTYTINP